MNWSAFFALLKRHPGKTLLGVAAIFSAASGFSLWLWNAETCHAQTKANEATIEELVEFQRAAAREREAEAKLARQALEERKRLCTAKLLTDKALCSTVGVAVE